MKRVVQEGAMVRKAREEEERKAIESGTGPASHRLSLFVLCLGREWGAAARLQ